MADDKRKDTRYPTKDFQIEVRFASWTLFKFSFVANLSKGGMLLHLKHKPAIGEKFKVKLQLPNGQNIELDTEVRHVQEGKDKGKDTVYQVGVQFKDMTGDKLALVKKLIDEVKDKK
jgi:hypothetical protein